jgi:glycosyltransferase involved in cell wall biosynthesis
MKISVVIPTYNGRAWIGATIASALAQTMPPFEIVVVNDGSTDGTADVLREFGEGIRVVSQANRGLSAARNVGIGAARGEMIALLDDDDLWFPEKLALQAAVLAERPEVGLVFSDIECFDHASGDVLSARNERSLARLQTVEAGPGVRLLERSAQFRAALDDTFALPSTLLIRRAALDAVGPFDETLRYAEDWQMLLRLATVCEFAYVNRVLVRRRIRGNSLSARGQSAADFVPPLERLLAIARLDDGQRRDLHDMLARLHYDAAYFLRKEGHRDGARAHLRAALDFAAAGSGRRFAAKERLRAKALFVAATALSTGR